MKCYGKILCSLLLAMGLTACGGGSGEDAGLEPITTPVPVATVSGAQAIVRWSPVAHAETYQCELTEEGYSPKMEEVQASQYSFTMRSGVAYRVRVKALPGANKGYEASAWSDYVAFSYQEEQKPDPTPTPEPQTLKLPAAEQDGVIRAFPGAEGGGMFTTGGRGGKVIHVTNLNDSGAGSLRAAVNESGARTIVFDVAGTIELQSDLRIKKGDLTIAGQTAPGGGICLRNYSTVVDADNVIIRFLRFRPGVDGIGGDGRDALWGRYHKNIIIDHCSMSWSTDECSSFYANQHFTMQWCLLAESLHNAGHTKGSHGYGGVWDGVSASFHHNLLANHDSRNPRFGSPNTYAPNATNHDIKQSERSIDYRNNVVYNFCSNSAYGGEGAKMNFVANYYKWGPGSINGKGMAYKNDWSEEDRGKRRSYFYQVDGKYTTGGVTYDEGAAHIFTDGNSNYFDSSIDPSSSVGAQLMADNRRGFPLSEGSISEKSPEVTWLDRVLPIRYNGTACSVTSHTAPMAYARVLDYAGASLCRDAVDARNVTHTRAATFYKNGSMGSKNGIIDLPEDVGGYPVLTATGEEIQRATADTDKDEIPDYYEEQLGLDKTKADATLKTLDPQGLYTNFEIYLHYLVQDITAAQTEGGNYTKLE
ncbi:MAG: pectate lyase [Rikenellaceae bacterium]|nr:pectate lyase [Rikenellaceae bacterium]